MKVKPIILCLLIAGSFSASAQQTANSMLFNAHVGGLLPQTKTVELTDGSLPGGTLQTGYDFGLSLQFLHSERISTRWGYTWTYQDVEFGGVSSTGKSALTSYHRNSSVISGQALIHVANGIGKTWYLIAGVVAQQRKTEAKAGSWLVNGHLINDTMNKTGAQLGTGVSFNFGKWRLSPEVIYQQVGKEGSILARVNVGR